MKIPTVLLAFASITPFLPSDDDGIDRVDIFLNGEFVTSTNLLSGKHLTLDLKTGDTLGLVAWTDWGGIWKATVDVHRCPETWGQRLTRVSDLRIVHISFSDSGTWVQRLIRVSDYYPYEAIFSMVVDTTLVGEELELVLNYDPGIGMQPWHFLTIVPSGGEQR